MYYSPKNREKGDLDKKTTKLHEMLSCNFGFIFLFFKSGLWNFLNCPFIILIEDYIYIAVATL